MLIGLAATVLVGFAVFSLERKLPQKKMLMLTGVMVTWVLVVMVGTTVQIMQTVGWLPVSPIAGLRLPYWSGVWFGVYPTWEGVLLQLSAFVFVIGSYLAAEARAQAPPQPRVRALHRARRAGARPRPLSARPATRPRTGSPPRRRARPPRASRAWRRRRARTPRGRGRAAAARAGRRARGRRARAHARQRARLGQALDAQQAPGGRDQEAHDGRTLARPPSAPGGQAERGAHGGRAEVDAERGGAQLAVVAAAETRGDLHHARPVRRQQTCV